MDQKTDFERFLYGDGNEIVINDMEFCVDRIIMLPKIRPHQLDKTVRLSVEYCKFADFRRRILEKSTECPVLIYKLYKYGVFVFDEIQLVLEHCNAFMLCYYFRKEMDDFEYFIRTKSKPYGFDESFIDNGSDIDQLIEYGFYPSSIEYCLKYDVIDDLINISIPDQEAKWSPFEWSNRPNYLDFLSFAGFFGSIRCFKHLLLNGFELNNKVLSMVSCSGCFDLFHLSREKQNITIECFCKASEFFHPNLLEFMVENGVDMNAKSDNLEF